MIVRYNWWQCLLSSNVGHVGFQKYNWLNRYVSDINFWHNVTLCIKAKYPLIKVFQLGDSDEKPTIGLIYKTMDRVEKRIQVNLGSLKKKVSLLIIYLIEWVDA